MYHASEHTKNQNSVPAPRNCQTGRRVESAKRCSSEILKSDQEEKSSYRKQLDETLQHQK